MASSKFPSLFASLCLSLLSAGCVMPARKVAMRDLAKLPRSEGNYGGKFLLSPPWLYFGSDDSSHYFLYTYTSGNNCHDKRLKIPRSDLRLTFETPFSGYDANGMAVVPLYGIGSGIYGFSRVSSPDPKELGWNGQPSPLPSFDQKLPPTPKVEALTIP